MDLRHLQYFQAVAEELSFSKAARKLHVAQPALSRTVKELEGMLRLELLARTRRSVALTSAGAVLLDEATRRVQRTAAGEEGELRLGYIGPPTQIFLGRIVKEFRRRYPRVTVIMEERTPERVWEMVARGHLAVGLTRPALPPHPTELHTLILRHERLCAALLRGHPLSKDSVIRWGQLKK